MSFASLFLKASLIYSRSWMMTVVTLLSIAMQEQDEVIEQPPLTEEMDTYSDVMKLEEDQELAMIPCKETCSKYIRGFSIKDKCMFIHYSYQ